MGCFQASQPLLGIPIPMARRAPGSQGRQQPLWPPQRFVVARVRTRVPSGWASREGTRPGLVRCFGHHGSTFLRPLALPALPGFLATMDALTPTRGLFGSFMNTTWSRAGLPVSCIWPSDHSVSNHPAGPVIALTRYPSASRISGSLRSRLRQYLAGSPPGKAESSLLALRTGRSPPVASHLLFRVRSYHWLQAGERVPEEDLHLSDQMHSRSH